LGVVVHLVVTFLLSCEKKRAANFSDFKQPHHRY